MLTLEPIHKPQVEPRQDYAMLKFGVVEIHPGYLPGYYAGGNRWQLSLFGAKFDDDRDAAFASLADDFEAAAAAIRAMLAEKTQG